jgi:hypothetical protein
MKNLMIRRNAEIFKILFQVTVHRAYFPYRVPIESGKNLIDIIEVVVYLAFNN